MLVSYNWLKQYVNLPDSVSAGEVAEKLKMSTVEVEGIIKQGELLGNVVVGKVMKAAKHPQADKLTLCEVDAGNEKLQIVCGGSNVREGMLVALAKVGAKVKWHGADELVELKPTAIRGIESSGMICSAPEIGLEAVFPPKSEKEIIDLSGTAATKQIGKPLAEVLGLNDAIFEIDNKSLSNRPDLWGHYGMAREVAALFGKPLKEYAVKNIKPPKKGIDLTVEIKDSKLCPRYMAVVMSGIKIAESPDWLKQRLLAAGHRPINNIVDITNYVMQDIGEPMHAFDAERIKNYKSETPNPKIIVRRAEKGETLVLLDGAKVELSPGDLLIADEEKPLALAGVMGGELSGVTGKTSTIIFEAASFDAAAIRKTSIRLGLRTDASARFEKSIDPNWCELAMKRAVELVQQICPGAKVAGAVVDQGKFTVPTGPIVMNKNIFSKKLGVEIPPKQIIKILEQLGFAVGDKGDELSVKIPTWRATKDIGIAEDLVEEAARIYGYDKIAASLPAMPITPPERNLSGDLEYTVRDVLARGLGMSEVYNYSFVSREQAGMMEDKSEYLELDNPVSKEKPLLRRSLLPNLLENAVKNIEYFDTVAIFEIGKVFRPELAGVRSSSNGPELLPRQDTYLAVLFAEKKNENPLTAARRALERLADELNLSFEIDEAGKRASWQHPKRAGNILTGGAVIGEIFEVDPAVADEFGMDRVRVGALEINLDLLAEAARNAPEFKYKKPSAFPEVARDLSFVVDKGAAHEDIDRALIAADPLIKKVELFDVYEGKNLAGNKKSMAYRLTLTHPERTLNSAEADEVMKKAISALKKFGAEVRT